MREELADSVIAVYLFGSAVQGGLRPSSDLDVMVVTTRRTTQSERQALVEGLLRLSRRPRHLEVTIVVESDVRPWRYPPRTDFQYGDWWRHEFESGQLQPWKETNPDLASLIRMVLIADTPLQGPRPSEVFDPVPRSDYIAALVDGIPDLLRDLESDTRNVVLTLARIWSGVTTDEIPSKDAAADWALPRLPQRHRGVLEEARSIYLGARQQESKDVVHRARLYAEYVLEEIRQHVPPDSPRRWGPASRE